MAFTVLICAVYCVAVYCGYNAVFVQKSATAYPASEKTFKTAAVLLLLLAAGIRIYFAVQDYYFPTDVNNFKAWGAAAVSHGWKNVYFTGMFLDYPPGYIYILSLLYGITNLFSADLYSTAATAIFKIPAMAADFALAFLLYRLCSDNGFEKNKSAFVAFVYLFMPTVVLNSSVWGQIESWYLFFVLLSFRFAQQDKTLPAAASYAWALITKPQAIMFGPVLMFWIIKRKSFREFFKAIFSGALFFYLMALPFCQSPTEILWLAQKYVNTVNGYGYYTVNGFNLYYILGLNWVALKGGTMSLINPAVVAASVALCGYIILKKHGYSGFYTAAAVTICLIFCLCTMMHERYIWPCCVMCLFAFAATGQKALLPFGVAFGCLNYLNSHWAMAMYTGPFAVHQPPAVAVSWATCLLTAVFVAWTVYTTKKETKMSFKKLLKPNITVAAVTVIYALFALFHLGSTKAPQTFFSATEDNYYFTVEFDKPVHLGSIYTYSGIGDQFSEPECQKLPGDFEISLSADGKNFDVSCDIGDMSVYTWKSTIPDTSGYPHGVKAVRVRAKFLYNVLYEIAFFDTEGNLVKGTLAENSSTNPYSAANAFDEQDTVPADTSYFGSMYFDEIYHGRTAYEQLKGYTIYETTHPPLGKILISIGISLFGMTPFGWRIVGALCGVAMLPIIYLLVNTLCQNRMAGCLAATLLALDFMHLTQTRIATVDTYVVLFVLLTFLFMARWHNTPWGDKKGWLNLALSGVFMGCAVASKWNGAYPMVALAVLFFISLGFKYKGCEKTKAYKALVVKTLLLCCVFFVAVPLVIYSASYIPVIHADSFADYLHQLVQYQIHMYDYHSNLVADHFFSSMWYSWPFNLKPIWYSITEKGALASSISAFGNPAIWVLTPFAALYCLIAGIKNKSISHLFASLGWLSAYLPWVMVTRLCFIYHYFPCAVFGIIAIALAAKDICSTRSAFKKAVFAYLFVCLVMFIVFLPVTTGIWVNREYLDFLEFLPDWHFVNL